jgi:hypothetical protein
VEANRGNEDASHGQEREGVREGLIYELKPKEDRKRSPQRGVRLALQPEAGLRKNPQLPTESIQRERQEKQPTGKERRVTVRMIHGWRNQEAQVSEDTTEEQMKQQLKATYHPRREWRMETRDERGRPRERYEVNENWEYSVEEEPIIAETWCNGKSKAMEVSPQWNQEQMHEELRRHWGVKAERSEIVMRRNGVEQVVFGTGAEWTYDLRVSAGVCGGSVNWHSGNRGGSGV